MLLDTSGLLCHFDVAEARHSEATNYFKSSHRLLTHSYVLAEFIPLCQVRRLPRRGALAFAVKLLSNSLVKFVWVDEQLHRSALALLQARMD